MNVLKISALALTLTLGMTQTVSAQSKMKEKTVMVGGAAMYPSKNIVENAMNSKDHTTLVAAVNFLVKSASNAHAVYADSSFFNSKILCFMQTQCNPFKAKMP